MRSNASMRERATVDRRWSRVCAYENAISLSTRSFGRLSACARKDRFVSSSCAIRFDSFSSRSLRASRSANEEIASIPPFSASSSWDAEGISNGGMPSGSSTMVQLSTKNAPLMAASTRSGVRETKVTNKPWSRR